MCYIYYMANILKTEKQIAIIIALAEGSSIRSIERMTGINRNTIMNLGVRIRQGVTVFQMPPATTPENVVKAAIVSELKNDERIH